MTGTAKNTKLTFSDSNSKSSMFVEKTELPKSDECLDEENRDLFNDDVRHNHGSMDVRVSAFSLLSLLMLIPNVDFCHLPIQAHNF